MNEFWSGSNTGRSEPLTFAKIQEAVRKAVLIRQPEEIQFLVHPLRHMLISRACDPLYCPYIGIPLDPNWKGLYDQTHADYNGWGINGHA